LFGEPFSHSVASLMLTEHTRAMPS
jgi:hypothetical protein